MYHIDLTTHAILAIGLPDYLLGLDPAVLAEDMGWWNTDDLSKPGPLGGTSFWPEVADATVIGGPVVDPATKTVRVQPVPVPKPAPAPLTPLAFARRLTQAERIAVRGSTDAVVVDFLWMLDRATEVRLDDPDTAAGVGYMAAIGLLTAERAAAILTMV